MKREKEYINRKFDDERALFGEREVYIENCTFVEGESPLKESAEAEIENTVFSWKYPIWYSENIFLNNCKLEIGARAGIWYTNNITVLNTIIEAPKNFRRCNGMKLENVRFTAASETMWHCKNVDMKNVFAVGDYFAMDSTNIVADNIEITGGYSFDGCENVVIKNSRLISKDSFWNSKNVTVYDSYISGEYIGWNAENLTFINCEIESLQGLCYIKNLVMKNCTLKNTNLAFEKSSVDVSFNGRLESVFNPQSGIIRAEAIDELIFDSHCENPEATEIIATVNTRKDKAEFK